MPPNAPSFGSQEYWDARFTANSNPFEWLEAPTVFDSYLVEALSATGDSNPQLLHIGCGTSLLSYHLRAHVKDPGQIHNLDYSEVAVEIGKKREVDIYKEHPMLEDEKHGEVGYGSTSHKVKPVDIQSSGGQVEEPSQAQQQATTATKGSYMRWSAADLLGPFSLLKACQPSSYSIIVDKSTSDSIACSDDLYVPLPYPVSTTRQTAASASKPTKSPEPIHPLHIMAVHLALIAKPKARWISLSYSLDRFPFLPESSQKAASSPLSFQEAVDSKSTTHSVMPADEGSEEDSCSEYELDDIPRKIIEGGFPDPSRLWKLAGKYPIEAPPPADSTHGNNGAATAHRPKIMHCIYVLERTEVKLHVKN
jgi:hypothetical protein